MNWLCLEEDQVRDTEKHEAANKSDQRLVIIIEIRKAVQKFKTKKQNKSINPQNDNKGRTNRMKNTN